MGLDLPNCPECGRCRYSGNRKGLPVEVVISMCNGIGYEVSIYSRYNEPIWSKVQQKNEILSVINYYQIEIDYLIDCQCY